MRRGLLRQVDIPAGPLTGETLTHAQDSVRDAVELLAADDDLVQAPVRFLAATGPIPTSATVVVYRGAAGQTLSLPPAAGRGKNLACVVYLINAASVAVTLARTGVDTLNGGTSLSLAAGKLAILVSDGVSLWKAATS